MTSPFVGGVLFPFSRRISWRVYGSAEWKTGESADWSRAGTEEGRGGGAGRSNGCRRGVRGGGRGVVTGGEMKGKGFTCSLITGGWMGGMGERGVGGVVRDRCVLCLFLPYGFINSRLLLGEQSDQRVDFVLD